MKKALAILMTLALVASAATAEITWGAWGRGAFVPAASDGTNTTAVTRATWGGNPRIGFGVNGSSDNMGFHVDLTGDVASVGIGDQAKIWWKASDMFKLEIGKVQFDALRGKVGDAGGFHNFIAGGACKDEDNIFQRFYPGCGAVAELTPVEGLVIAAAIDPSSTATKAETVYKKIQAGAGYTIAGVGQIRAQYIGNSEDVSVDATTSDITINASRIEAAFAFTGVEGLTLDVGGKIPLAFTADSVKYQKAFVVAAGAKYAKDAFSVMARVDADLGDSYSASILGYDVKVQKGSTISIYAEPAYALDFATIGVDANYVLGGDSTATIGTVTSTAKGKSYFGVAPFIKKAYSNGYIKAGFAVNPAMNDGDKLSWSVPVVLEYWF